MTKIIWRYEWRRHTFEIHKTEWGYHFYCDGVWLFDERAGKFRDDDDAIETFRKLNNIPRIALEEGKVMKSG